MKKIFSIIILGSIVPAMVAAAPSISGVSGTFSHGQTVTVSGTGFGTKTTAEPMVWDDCSGTDILDKWSGGWPSESGSLYNIDYRTPSELARGVGLPHDHASQYLAGCHFPGGGALTGYNVMVWKNRELSPFPYYSYISFYTRVDPLFNSGDNFKWFDYSTRDSPYTMRAGDDSNWYLEQVGGLNNSHHLGDDGDTAYRQAGLCISCDYGWRSTYHGGPAADWSTTWSKIEIIVKYTDQNDGWYDVYENGVHIISPGSTCVSWDPCNITSTGNHTYNGPTDRYRTDLGRNEAIGGFVRNDGDANNWRYFSDLYLDYSLARVVLGDQDTLVASTVREVQVPTIWANGTINLTFNQASFDNGQTAYLYVFDQSGAVNENGFPVTVAASSDDTQPPSAPTGLAIY